MKINLTSELSKLVTDDLIQFAKCGKKLVAKTKTKKMEVGDKILPIKGTEDDSSLLNAKKTNGIGTILGPSETVRVPLRETKKYWGEQGTRALGSRAGYAQSLQNPNDTVAVPLSQVRFPKTYDKLIKK